MYLISDIAKKSGLSTDTIRFYEKKGFIQPNFRANNQYRYYSDDALKRLIFMKHCRALDMSLKTIQKTHTFNTQNYKFLHKKIRNKQ